MRNIGTGTSDSMEALRVRPYAEKDLNEVVDLFTGSVRQVNCSDYTQEQIDVWAPLPPRYQRWAAKLGRQMARVAVKEGRIVGIGTFEENGHVDLFYVHPEFQRCGIGAGLFRQIEIELRGRNVARLFAEASITARPFFERMGLKVVTEQMVVIERVGLRNFVMEKFLRVSGQGG